MSEKTFAPRNSPVEQTVRMNEPYKFQRDRQLFNKQPRFAQPNTFQPNQKPPLIGWGMSTQQYYVKIFEAYLKGRM